MTLDPVLRGRIAFTTLCVSLCLIAADRTVASGDPSLLFLLTPAIAVVATGHITSREAFLRSAISVATVVVAGMMVNIAAGQGIPDYQSFNILTTALTGLFALHLVTIVITSLVVQWLWPTSDHWTR